MTFKLSKAESSEKNVLIDELREAYDHISEKEAEVQGIISNAVGELNGAIRAYNEKLSETENWVNSIAERLRGEFDDKSEGWQESDRGQSAESFVSEWEALDFTALNELTEPDLEVDSADHADNLEAASEEVE